MTPRSAARALAPLVGDASACLQARVEEALGAERTTVASSAKQP